MKKILFILVFIPLVSFSQSDLTFEDIKKIDSKTTFIKTVIENGYSRDNVKVQDNGTVVTSYRGLKNFFQQAQFIESGDQWVYYFDFYNIKAFDAETGRPIKNIYQLAANNIIQAIINECNFYKSNEEKKPAFIRDNTNDETWEGLYYSCSESKYPAGYMGFFRSKDGSIRIRSIPAKN